MIQELTLLQINDVHAYLDLHPELFFGPRGPVYRQVGGYARIAAMVKDIQSQNPQGTLFSITATLCMAPTWQSVLKEKP